MLFGSLVPVNFDHIIKTESCHDTNLVIIGGQELCTQLTFYCSLMLVNFVHIQDTQDLFSHQ